MEEINYMCARRTTTDDKTTIKEGNLDIELLSFNASQLKRHELSQFFFKKDIRSKFPLKQDIILNDFL